jgi:hypothetical protein
MLRDGSVTERVLYTNLAIVVFTNLGSEAGLICKPQLRPVTTLKCCEAVSRKPINKPFTYNGLPRFQTVDLSPQFRKGNFDAVCCTCLSQHPYTYCLPFSRFRSYVVISIASDGHRVVARPESRGKKVPVHGVVPERCNASGAAVNACRDTPA